MGALSEPLPVMAVELKPQTQRSAFATALWMIFVVPPLAVGMAVYVVIGVAWESIRYRDREDTRIGTERARSYEEAMANSISGLAP